MTDRKVLFIEGAKSFIHQAVVNKLEQADFKVYRVRDDIDEIAKHKDDSKLILYYPTGSRDYIETVTIFLLDLCEDEDKTLCVIGDKYDIEIIERIDEFNRIFKSYKRPVDMNKLVKDMCQLSDSHDELRRTKTILVVDDDPDFLKVMARWLKYDYSVDTVRSGTEALLYVANCDPDLILLDYDMPGMDGYEVLDNLRSNLMLAHIPVIFLTGMDDKENVIRILQRKPDGYLLKTQRKEDLLGALEKFFVDSILNDEEENKKKFSILNRPALP